MSNEYQQLQSLDDSSVHIPIKQERAQELSTDVNSHSNHGHSHSHEGNTHTHSSGGGGHTHSHGGRPCNSDHGNSRVQQGHPSKPEGDRCGHNHAPGQGCDSKRSKTGSNWFIRIFTMGMPLNCIILQYFWLNEILAENKFEYFGSNVLMFFIIVMCFITYYQAVTIKNNPTKRAPPPCDPSIVDPLQKNNSVCKDCNSWKPMRTKHCKACGGCQLRMDHHCPWITNCVGLRNNRAFLLFTIYMAIGASQYIYKTFIYFQYLNTVDDFWIHGFPFYLYWAFTTLVLVPITIMLIGLSIFHSFLLINNATTLDTMGGLAIGFPFSPQQKIPPNKRSVNLFNRGLISNVRDFFSGDTFLFWWPFATYTPNDGTTYEMSPPCTFNDIQNIVQKQIVNEDGIDLNTLITDFENRIEAEKERLKECNLQVDNKIFELWKDLETQRDEAARKEQEKLLKRIKQEQKAKHDDSTSEPVQQTQNENDKEINIF